MNTFIYYPGLRFFFKRNITHCYAFIVYPFVWFQVWQTKLIVLYDWKKFLSLGTRVMDLYIVYLRKGSRNYWIRTHLKETGRWGVQERSKGFRAVLERCVPDFPSLSHAKVLGQKSQIAAWLNIFETPRAQGSTGRIFSFGTLASTKILRTGKYGNMGGGFVDGLAKVRFLTTWE